MDILFDCIDRNYDDRSHISFCFSEHLETSWRRIQISRGFFMPEAKATSTPQERLSRPINHFITPLE